MVFAKRGQGGEEGRGNTRGYVLDGGKVDHNAELRACAIVLEIVVAKCCCIEEFASQALPERSAEL